MKTYKWYLGAGTEVQLTVIGSLLPAQTQVLQKYLEALQLTADIDAAPVQKSVMPVPEEKRAAEPPAPKKAPPAYLSMYEVADYLGLNFSTVYHHAREGKFPVKAIGGRKMVAKSDLDNYVVERTTRAVKAAVSRKMEAKGREIRLNGLGNGAGGPHA